MNFFALDPFPPQTLNGICPSCMNPGMFGMGSLGAENCQDYLTRVDIYTRLSKKTDKSKETRARAAQMAADNQAGYNACVDRNATASVQAAIAPVVPATTTASTVSTVANSLLQAATQALVPGQVVTPGQVIAPVTQPVALPATAASTGWLTPKNLMIAGGVLAVGALIYFMMRNRK